MRLLSVLPLLPALGLFACSDAPGDTGTRVRDGGMIANGVCAHPGGALEPMTEGAVIWPYRWGTAIAADNSEAPLDLEAVHCATDAAHSFDNTEFLLFVSAPAW